MGMIDFTDEELYFIESQFDCLESFRHKHFMEIAEKFMLVNAMEIKDKQLFLVECIKIIEEFYKTGEVMRSIRSKCEKARRGVGGGERGEKSDGVPPSSQPASPFSVKVTQQRIPL